MLKPMNPAWSFWNGWNQVAKARQAEVREDLMGVFGITSLFAFKQRRAGRIEPKVSEKSGVEAAFKKQGVPASKVWGDNRKSE